MKLFTVLPLALLTLLLAAPPLVLATEITAQPPSAANGADMVAKFSLRDAPFAMAIDLIAEWLDTPEVLIEPEVATGGVVSTNLTKVVTNKHAANALRDILMLNGVDCVELPGDVLYFRRPRGLSEFPPRLDMGSMRIRWRAHAANAETLLRRMGVWSGREIGFDSTALAAVAPITLDVGPTLRSANEMFVAAGAVLRRAGIVLDEQPDGSYRVRLVPKPAQPAAPAPAPAAKQP